MSSNSLDVETCKSDVETCKSDVTVAMPLKKQKGYSYKKARNEKRKKQRKAKLLESKTPPRELTKAEIRELEIQSDMDCARDTFF